MESEVRIPSAGTEPCVPECPFVVGSGSRLPWPLSTEEFGIGVVAELSDVGDGSIVGCGADVGVEARAVVGVGVSTEAVVPSDPSLSGTVGVFTIGELDSSRVDVTMGI